MTAYLPSLCGEDGCQRLSDHHGNHSRRPTEAWAFLQEKDRNKLVKAGWATPRGGERGGYQNHVVRSSQVVIPYERLEDVDLSLYREGYAVRLLPDQYFQAPGIPNEAFTSAEAKIIVGQHAFVLYRTHESLRKFPPLPEWKIRSLLRNGEQATSRRGNVTDSGHYILRLSRIGDRSERIEGPPQGIFATEYADEETNFLCKCVLAWLIAQTAQSPYTLTQATHLRAILMAANLEAADSYERRGALRHGISCCPLCTRFIRYSELHEPITFKDEGALANAGVQVVGSTRSTIVNLFHLSPLVYHSLTHVPENTAWGHAICNTRLGQRHCFSLSELIEMDRKVGIVREHGIETFGWISSDWKMIRSPNSAVWIQLNGDADEGPPNEPAFDSVAERTDDAGDMS